MYSLDSDLAAFPVVAYCRDCSCVHFLEQLDYVLDGVAAAYELHVVVEHAAARAVAFDRTSDPPSSFVQVIPITDHSNQQVKLAYLLPLRFAAFTSQ